MALLEEFASGAHPPCWQHFSRPSNSFFIPLFPLSTIYLRTIPRVSNISHGLTMLCEKIRKGEKDSFEGRYVNRKSKLFRKVGRARFTPHRPPFGIDLTRTVHESRRIVNYPRIVSAVRMHKIGLLLLPVVAVALLVGGNLSFPFGWHASPSWKSKWERLHRIEFARQFDRALEVEGGNSI